MKSCIEMNFKEFSQWAKEQIIREFLKSGLDGLDTAVFLILNQAQQNKVWGGGKKK